MAAWILAYCNQKGGVGKTTTVFHHARAAVKAGKRVLLVDLDPQGNISAVTVDEPTTPDQAGMADVISSRDPATLRDVIVPGVWDGLHVAPSTNYDALAGVREELTVAGAGREQRLKEALRDVGEEYDLILIDCAPSLDQLTINALTAANRVIVVAEAALFAADGLGHMLNSINNVHAYYNPGLQVAGIVMNRFDAQSPEEVTWLREIKDAAEGQGIPIINPVMRKRVVVKKAMEAATGLDQYGDRSSSSAAEIYDNHMATILEGAHQ